MELKYFMPVKVIAGRDCVIKNSSEFCRLGTKAVIVTGRHSSAVNGSLSDVEKALETEGISYCLFNKIESNPTLEMVYEGAEFAKKNGADFVIAIGGGSPMDSAKAISMVAASDIPKEKFFKGDYTKKALPMVFVPTTSGTGSEVTEYSIITNDEAKTKTSLAGPELFPDVAFEDAKYTESLPLVQSINTAVDSLTHSVEGMLSKKANAVTDILAARALKSLSECFEDLKSGDISYESRQKLMFASMLGGMVIAHTGTTAVHSMGYSLTYFKDIDHGRANGLLIGSFLEFVNRKAPEKISEILGYMGLKEVSELEDFIDCVLGKKENITENEAEYYTSLAMKAWNIPNCVVPPSEKDILECYKKSLVN